MGRVELLEQVEGARLDLSFVLAPTDAGRYPLNDLELMGIVGEDEREDDDGSCGCAHTISWMEQVCEWRDGLSGWLPASMSGGN